MAAKAKQDFMTYRSRKARKYVHKIVQAACNELSDISKPFARDLDLTSSRVPVSTTATAFQHASEQQTSAVKKTSNNRKTHS